MTDQFKEFSDFLKQKEKFIKEIEQEKETKKKITYGIDDDLARGIEEYQKKLNLDVSQDFDKSYGQNYFKIVLDSLKTLFGILTFSYENLKKAYLITSTKRLFVLYALFALGLGGSLLFLDQSKLELAPYAITVVIISPFILYILNEVASMIQQIFFFIFSGEKKNREISIINAYSIFLLLPLFYIKGSIFMSYLFIALAYILILESWALSHAFKIKKWQSFSALLLIVFLAIGTYIFLKVFWTKIEVIVPK